MFSFQAFFKGKFKRFSLKAEIYINNFLSFPWIGNKSKVVRYLSFLILLLQKLQFHKMHILHKNNKKLINIKQIQF